MKFNAVIKFFLALLCGVSCIDSASAQSTETIRIIEQTYGTVKRDTKWRKMPIPVCWENPTRENLPHRKLTQQAVEETWEKHSQVRFKGWGACKAKPDEGINIVIGDVHPRVKTLGRYLDGMPGGMELNFSFSQWGAECRVNPVFCIKAIAAHEFGHALGFAHEQNRDDAPPVCRGEKKSGAKGDFNITYYDPYSIMNYCNPKWIGDGKLSRLDILAVEYFYAR